MSRPGLPIFGLIADPAGEEDEFVRLRWREHEVLRVASHHAEAVDEHADEEVGLAEIFTGRAGDEACLNEGGKGAECVRRA